MAHTPGPWLIEPDHGNEDEIKIWAREPHIGTLATVHLIRRVS